MKGDISSPSVLITLPRFTGSVHLFLSFNLVNQISLPPYPPGLLLEKKSVLPSALIDGVDSQWFVLTGAPRLYGSDHLPLLKAEKYRSQFPKPSGRLHAVKYI